MYQLYTGEVLVSKMKPVQIEDLLGRDPIKADMTEVFEYIQGKVVLVTGVGSIGSELARQIAAHNPKHLILFDIYENNAYDIQLELIDPCIPHTLKGYTVTRRYRGATYHIRVENPSAVQKGVAAVVYDGKPLESNSLPIASPGTTVEVTVTMG